MYVFYHSLLQYISYTRRLGQARQDERGVCLGNDDINKVPIGCSVIRDYPVDKDVVQQ
jgi:hypothetical protein